MSWIVRSKSLLVLCIYDIDIVSQDWSWIMLLLLMMMITIVTVVFLLNWFTMVNSLNACIRHICWHCSVMIQLLHTSLLVWAVILISIVIASRVILICISGSSCMHDYVFLEWVIGLVRWKLLIYWSCIALILVYEIVELIVAFLSNYRCFYSFLLNLPNCSLCVRFLPKVFTSILFGIVHCVCAVW